MVLVHKQKIVCIAANVGFASFGGFSLLQKFLNPHLYSIFAPEGLGILSNSRKCNLESTTEGGKEASSKLVSRPRPHPHPCVFRMVFRLPPTIEGEIERDHRDQGGN